jgi:outer membrane protein TolC
MIALSLAFGLQVAQPALEQVPDTSYLSLAAAITQAQTGNPSLRAERAEARAAGQMPNEASTAYLPTITVDLVGLRTTDPVAVFGSKLRQGVFQASDFDLDELNNPDPYNSFNTVATIEQPLLVPEGWLGHKAANRGASAREAAANRVAGATTFQVTQAYWDVQYGARQLAALDTALATVRAHAARAEQMYDQGLVTGLDARLANLQAAEVEVGRVQAEAQLANAGSRLRAILGLPETAPLVLTDSLGPGDPGLCANGTSDCDLNQRGDLIALRLGVEAAGYGVDRAWASQLPFVFAFGSAGHYSNDAWFASGSGNWTVGLGLRWNILRGWAGPGEVNKAKADREAAEARAEAAARQADVEVRSANRMVAAARERVTVAERADAEGAEALEQARLRYRTGTSPITELLDVQAAATNATLNLLAASRDFRVAQAALDFAYGVNDHGVKD